jgi:PAS domain-containing protein
LRFKQRAIESSVYAIAFADPQALVTYANSAFLRTWGYDSVSDV